MQGYVHFLYFFTFLFTDIHCFFSPGRDQLMWRAGQKNLSPVLTLYTTLDRRADLVDMVLAKS